MPKVWFNGAITDEDDARISIRDFGLLHAAGVFTTMRASGGEIVRLDAHLSRLRASCTALSIPLPFTDEELHAATASLLQVNELAAARLRLTVTRGEPAQLENGEPGVRPNVFITAVALEPYSPKLYESGITVLAYDEYRLSPYDVQAGHKTLNYLSRFAALHDAQSRGANEALLFNTSNHLQSATIANVFLVSGNALLTPPTTDEIHGQQLALPYPRGNVLPGTTRGAVLDAASGLGISIQRRAVTINDLLGADEVFLTNSVIGVMPVCRIERKPVGNEKPGEITLKLREAVDQSERVPT